ncbi:NC domain-containing protein-like protein [Heracleum sosnowskyi]|uniref:NC domain-containing protein-like protein n=1 Tax=Heracleum sosnowskyi TaxID=360622 RepID=A0AAD8HMK5_9APIA|nr:NC domain-containing protein-like protein [Heracleum sosnowskyi]
MGILTNKVNKDDIKEGDHIYTYRAAYTYSHHGIFVEGNRVVHFTPNKEENSRTQTFQIGISGISDVTFYCPTSYLDCEINCGFRKPNSGVVLSCLSCFLQKGALYRFEYGVSKSLFFTRVRGGTCTTAASDGPHTVIHRAMYLLYNEFGDKLSKLSGGSSGQASSIFGAPVAAFVGSSLMYLMVVSPVGAVTAAAATYSTSRYSSDIGVRADVTKVAVEDVAVKLGRRDSNKVRDENRAAE